MAGIEGLAVSQQLRFEVGRGFDAALLGEVGVVGRDLVTEQEHGIIKVVALVADAVEDGVELLGQEQVGGVVWIWVKDAETVE
jgi:hypothetical protein